MPTIPCDELPCSVRKYCYKTANSCFDDYRVKYKNGVCCNDRILVNQLIKHLLQLRICDQKISKPMSGNRKLIHQNELKKYQQKQEFISKHLIIRDKKYKSIDINVLTLIADIFYEINTKRTGFISQAEINQVILRMNSRLGFKYGEYEASEFFKSIDKDNDNKIYFNEFIAAFDCFI
jgi:hypothetical protein